jgi:hypothetical protein
MVARNKTKFTYSMYLANKIGEKKNGYPELDFKLILSKTNINRFYL